MNISYNWLREYIDFDLTPDELAAALTSIGLETGSVDVVQSVKGGLHGLVVGEVLTCEEHPNSDHLHVCTVDLGTGQPTQIVCGAPNVAAGQKVIVAPLGATLYDGDKAIEMKRMKLRGVESNGMICAEDEIGVGTSHDGIIVLPQDTPVGMPAREYYQLKDDYCLEVDITPNRADACSHYGVARDLYAYLRCASARGDFKFNADALHKPLVESFKIDNTQRTISVTVENTEACPCYAGVTITGVTVGDSPKWLKDRLTAIGINPINNIVDVTNYVLHAIGQPLHAFDADKVGSQVIVRTMPGTVFTTLDGVERKLHEQDLTISNDSEPMCIGGVFGGAKSGVTGTTTNIFLESAYFNPTWIRRTARRHGLNTDASFRYERGIDPNIQVYALKLAALLIQEVGGGKVSSEIQVVGKGVAEGFAVELQYADIDALLGVSIPHETVKDILQSLEIKIAAESDTALSLLVPPYRVDVQRPCDVIEDILRIYGYNNVEMPTHSNVCYTQQTPTDRQHKLNNLLAEQLVGMGFNEILNNSLTRTAYYEGEEDVVNLLNPLSQDLKVMRKSMLFGGLETIVRNINHQRPDLRLFEFGNTYTHTDGEYRQQAHLALWITGKRVANSWAHPNEDSSVYEMKAYVERLLQRLGMAQYTIDGESVVVGKTEVVRYGIVDRKTQRALDIEQEVYYADLLLDNIYSIIDSVRSASTSTELPKYPAVKRDLALLIDTVITFADIEKTARAANAKLLRSVSLFDVYEGKNLPEGKKSYAVSFILQDDNATLTDKQIDKTMQQLINAFQTKLNAQLR